MNYEYQLRVCEIENLCGWQSRQAMRVNPSLVTCHLSLVTCHPLVKQKVEEEIFNQPTQIEEGDASATLSSRIELFYGVNQQRNKAMMYKDSTLASTCYYFGKYFEKEITGSTDTARRYDYIYGDNGVVALHNTTILPSTDTTGGGGDPRVVADGTYYIHTDHLGSYCALTDLNKKVVQRNYFDPWGNFKWVFSLVFQQ